MAKTLDLGLRGSSFESCMSINMVPPALSLHVMDPIPGPVEEMDNRGPVLYVQELEFLSAGFSVWPCVTDGQPRSCPECAGTLFSLSEVSEWWVQHLALYKRWTTQVLC